MGSEAPGEPPAVGLIDVALEAQQQPREPRPAAASGAEVSQFV